MQEPLVDVAQLLARATELRAPAAAAASSSPNRREPDTTRVVVDLDKLLRCAICMEMLRPPLRQCFQEHTFCGICVERADKSAAAPVRGTCPLCRGPMRADDAHLLLVQALLECVPVSCPHMDSGCLRNDIPRAELQRHLASCPFRKAACKNAPHGCTWTGRAVDIERHEPLCLWRFSAEFAERVQQRLGPLEDRLNNLGAKLRELTLRRSASPSLMPQSERAAQISSNSVMEWTEEQTFDLQIRTWTEVFAWGKAWRFGVERLWPTEAPFFGAYLRCHDLDAPIEGFLVTTLSGDRGTTHLHFAPDRPGQPYVVRVQLPAATQTLFTAQTFERFLDRRYEPSHPVTVVFGRVRRLQPTATPTPAQASATAPLRVTLKKNKAASGLVIRKKRAKI